MKFLELARASSEVSELRARTKKTERLARVLAELGPEDLVPAVAFLCGETRQGRLGVGPSTLRKLWALPAAADATLTIAEVDGALSELAALSGKGKTAERERILGALFTRATRDEAEFLGRTLLGELRQGALEGVVIEALAAATRVSSTALRRAFLFAGNLGQVAAVAATRGEAGLAEFALQLFRPLLPMLADSADSAEAALASGEPMALEYKLDGARIQVHRSGDDVRVFSRQGNDVTQSVPEVVHVVRALPVREVVLDGEAIALGRSGAPLPFQTTMRRFGRRLNVDTLRQELPLSSFYFDCLALDGELLIDRSNAERVSALSERLPDANRVVRRVVESTAEARQFLDAALAAGHEGAVAKVLAAPYDAGRRGSAWLKIKPAHTLDLVVLAAEWGNGRRQGWLSNIHLGARDPSRESFVMLGKTFKGMTDEMLAWQTERFQALVLGQEGHVVHLKPELVVEIAFDGVQASPHYPAGLALRFARVKRYRPDKRAADADTLETVRGIFDESREPPAD